MASQSKSLTSYITEILGSGYSRTAIITSALITLIIFFYIFTLGSYLNVEIYGLKNRVTYLHHFQYVLVSSYFDKIVVSIATSACLLLIFRKRIELISALIYAVACCISVILNNPVLITATALLSFPWLIGILLYRRMVTKGHPAQSIDVKLIENYIVLAAIFLGIESIILSIITIFSPSSTLIHIYNYTYFMHILFSTASPFLVSLLVFCVPIKILVDELIKFITAVRKKTMGSVLRIDLKQYKMPSRNIYIFLSVSVILSIVFAAIPHIPSINEDTQLIGTDTDVYVKWETLLLNSNSTEEFLNISFEKLGAGDRPLSLLTFLSLAIASGGNLTYFNDRLPMILGPLLVLGIFFLSRELTSNDLISLFAAFLTAVSIQLNVGLFAGYYSNWFAMIFGYFTMIFMLKYLKRPAKANLLIFSSLLIIVLFSHAYTWTIFVLVIGIFLGIVAKLNHFRRKSAAILFVVILISVTIDLARVGITGSTGAFESDSSLALSQGVGLDQFRERWANLTETIWTYYGGLMSSFIMYSLAIYWLIRSNIREVQSILIMTFLSIGILPIVFSGWVIQSRVLYDIPFQIPAAIGIYFMTKSRFGTMLVMPVCIWLVALSLWAVSNLTLE